MGLLWIVWLYLLMLLPCFSPALPMMELLPLRHLNYIKHGCQEEKASSFMCIQKAVTALVCENKGCPLIIGLSSLESG